MFKSGKEKIVFAIFIIIVILLFFFKFRDEVELKRNGVFILGQFKNKSFGSESGWVYSYVYKYHNREYTRNFSCMASEQMNNDSLLFFRIITTNPKICRQLEDVKVPKCIKLSDVPENGWKTIPECK
jgi:hypothetical protein